MVVVLVLVCTGILLTGNVGFTPSDLSGDSGSLTVQVTNQTSNVQSGQEITVLDSDTNEILITSVTNQNGQVTFSDLPQDQYTVSVGTKTVSANLYSASQQVNVPIDVSPPTLDGPLSVTPPFQ